MVTYNYNTGKPLASGEKQATVAPSGQIIGTNKYVSGSSPTTANAVGTIEQQKAAGNVFNTLTGEKINYTNTPKIGQLENNIPLKFPTQTPADYSAALAKATALSNVNTDGTSKTTLEINKQGTDNVMQSWLDQLSSVEANRPSNAQLYRQAQDETQILAKQKAVSDYSSQLNAIQAQAEANKLAVTGQGRGIPEVIIGGQQAQISKEAAIQALPVAAQLSAAQGDYEMANQNLNTLYSIRSADAKAKYDFNTSIINSVKDYALGQEKTKLDYMIKQEDRAYNEKIALNKTAEDYSKMALANNQASLAGKIMALDSNSPTFKTDLSKLTGQLYSPVLELDRQIKQQQLDKSKAETAKIVSEISPVATSKDEVDKSITKYNLLKDTAQKAIDLSKGSGRSWVHETVGGIFTGITEKKQLEGLSNTLKSNILTMATDPNIKKFFGPQMTENDVIMMTSAGTTLNPNLQTPEQFKEEATRVLNMFERADKALKAGLPEYQYAKDTQPIIDKSGTALQVNPDTYANSVINQ